MAPMARADHRSDEAQAMRLLEAGRSVVAELDLETVLDRLLETARDLTGARYAAIGVLDEQRRSLERFLTSGIDPAAHAAIGDLPRGRGVLGVLIEDPRPLVLPDVSAHPRSYGFPAGHPPMGTFLGVPLLIRGEAWGNVYLTEKDSGPFDDADVHAVTVLADWAAIAIEHANLYARTAERSAELERAVEGLEATTAIARAIGSETDLSRVLELIVKRGRALARPSASTTSPRASASTTRRSASWAPRRRCSSRSRTAAARSACCASSTGSTRRSGSATARRASC